MTPEEWVEWIREETLKRFEAGEMDEAIPTNRRVLIDAIAAAVLAEREAWLAACREVAGWYPEGVFDPDGQTLDAKSAAMARLTVKNVQETRARIAQEEGEK